MTTSELAYLEWDGSVWSIASDQGAESMRSFGEVLAWLHSHPADRVFHGAGTGGDAEIIRMCGEGYLDVSFRMVRNNHVSACTLKIPAVVHLANAKVLTGLTTRELARFGRGYGAAASLDGLNRIADATFELVGVHPIKSGRFSVSGVMKEALANADATRRLMHAENGLELDDHNSGAPPINLEQSAAHVGGRMECYRVGKLGLNWRTDMHSAYCSGFFGVDSAELARVSVTQDCDRPQFWALGLTRPIYATGRVETWCWLDQVELPHGSKIHERHVIDLRWLRAASETVSTVYEAKRAAKDGSPLQTAAKKLIVNAYGGLAEKGEGQWAKFLENPPRGELVYYEFGDKFLTFGPLKYEVVRANYPFAARITETCRQAMYPAIVDPAVNYCATDSLFAYKRPHVEYGDAIGQFSQPQRKEFRLNGVHDYRFGSKLVRSGGSRIIAETLRGSREGGRRARLSQYDGRMVFPESGETRPWSIQEARERFSE